MRINGVNVNDSDYDRHMSGDCEADCPICQAERAEVFKKKNKKKNESQRPERP
jgi:hypothetical protein